MTGLERLLRYFSENHYLANFLFAAVLLGGSLSWFVTEKEARPNIAFNTIRITVIYPGASPDTAEQLAARPLENNLRGIQGVYEVESVCSTGSCSTSVRLDPDYPDKDETKIEIRNAVLSTDFPVEVSEIRNNPKIVEHKTSNIPLLDIGLINTAAQRYDDKLREKMQGLLLALENRLLALPHISESRRNGYLKKELRVTVNPEKMRIYEISFSDVITAINTSSVKRPIGNLREQNETRVSVDAELRTVDELKRLVIQGSFSGSSFVQLKDIATVQRDFEQTDSIFKINSHEAVSLSLIKSQGFDILRSRQAVFEVVRQFKEESLKNLPVEIVFIDDESRGIRNRLSIIGTNGVIGFVLILLVLFAFLDLRSGFWVAMGIPFTLGFTFMALPFLDYTINNVTLAGVIIVLGMVVDDAIIVSENINRMIEQGASRKDAVLAGAFSMSFPITASILTTIVAFLPLYFIPGTAGQFVKILPAIIMLMLGASLLESLFILPGHMNLRGEKVMNIIGALAMTCRHLLSSGRSSARDFDDFNRNLNLATERKKNPFSRLEEKFEFIVFHILKKRKPVLSAFLLVSFFLIGAGFLQYRFVMFPREEITEFFITGETAVGTKKEETAHLAAQVEDILHPYLGHEVMSYMTSIARSRRGAVEDENLFTITIEIPFRHERPRPVRELFAEWETKFREVKNIQNLRIVKSRWGSSQGSALELEVQSNHDSEREKAIIDLIAGFEENPEIVHAEREHRVRSQEYRLKLKRNELVRLNVAPEKISPTLRATLEGVVATRFYEGDEEVDIRVLARDASANSIASVLDVPVENRARYLVPLHQVVNVTKQDAPNTITRRDFQRCESVFGDLSEKSEKTPLEMAEYFEETLIPELRGKYPGVEFHFRGEVEESREALGGLNFAIGVVLFLIFSILMLLFRSLVKPLLIMFAIPFTLGGIVLTLFFHGIDIYGFFMLVGALGLSGVIVNDSIVMVDKLDKEMIQIKRSHDNSPKSKKKDKAPRSLFYLQEDVFRFIAGVAKTRLRAITLTTLTTVAGLFPTAYGIGGHDSMLSDMMLLMAWGLVYGTLITLFIIPIVYSFWATSKASLVSKAKEGNLSA